jgi:orotate phosphoribosyltransferase
MPADTSTLDTLRDLMQRHCFQYGDFTLASGRKSKFYFNGKRVTLRSSGAKLIGESLVDVVLASGAEAVGGPELGAVPIATAVGLASVDRGHDLPVFVVRREQKQYGVRDLVVEPYGDGGDVLTKGRRIAVVEDTITTGGSVQKAIDAVEALGCAVALIAVLVERAEGGAGALRERGYDVASLFNADDEGHLSVNPDFVRRLEAARAVA